MQKFESDYASLVLKVLIAGETRETRNVPTLSVFGESLSFDLREGFPILEGRKIFTKGILGEFAALVRKPKCLEDFEKWGCNYWDKWANPDGSINVDYGNAWFDFEGFDQIADLKDKLRNDPANRRMIVNAWRPHKLEELNLPCCHYSYQFHVSTTGVLNMVWTQRSVDVMIGLPSDMVLAAAWMISLANEFGFTPGVCKMDFGDTHIYGDHIDPAHDYLRQAQALQHKASVKWEYLIPKGTDFCKFEPVALRLTGYDPMPAIKFNLHG